MPRIPLQWNSEQKFIRIRLGTNGSWNREIFLATYYVFFAYVIAKVRLIEHWLKFRSSKRSSDKWTSAALARVPLPICRLERTRARGCTNRKEEVAVDHTELSSRAEDRYVAWRLKQVAATRQVEKRSRSLAEGYRVLIWLNAPGVPFRRMERRGEKLTRRISHGWMSSRIHPPTYLLRGSRWSGAVGWHKRGKW